MCVIRGLIGHGRKGKSVNSGAAKIPHKTFGFTNKASGCCGLFGPFCGSVSDSVFQAQEAEQAWTRKKAIVERFLTRKVVAVWVVTLILLMAVESAMPGFRPPDTLSLKFEREIVQDNSTEIVKGSAYYQAPQKIFIQVESPINQIMLIGGMVMLIYYPMESKAFRIKASNPISMPFVQMILSVAKDDYGLVEMGYPLGKHERKGDILYTYWDPPRKLSKKLGKFILGTSNGMLVYAEARDPKGKTAAKSFYKNHKELNGRHFPMETMSEIYSGSNVTKERIVYSDVEFDVPLPDEVVNFKLPDSIPVKEVEW